MPIQIQTGIPLIYEATQDTTSAPVAVGSLHGLTIGAYSQTWDGAVVTLFSSPINSTNMEDYAPVLFYDGSPVTFSANGTVPVLLIKPGSYLIAVLSSVGGSTEPVTVYIG